ncbi:nucleoside triphosphate pyrophosphohydrolase [Kitasatospora saccharophila]|uniref:Nucleoside triphosphate pyrophosphohydrolase n=1 Tax=Kitasatospora saccharophila TaxID=407973 RepID=A0ABP5JH58_9ACTN
MSGTGGAGGEAVAGRERRGKLVRDRIPEIIRAAGGEPQVHVADGDEYLARLEAKLHEEADEVRAAASAPEALEELADLLEVLRALAEAHGADFSRVEEIRRRKAEERGGFAGRIVWTGNR